MNQGRLPVDVSDFRGSLKKAVVEEQADSHVYDCVPADDLRQEEGYFLLTLFPAPASNSGDWPLMSSSC